MIRGTLEYCILFESSRRWVFNMEKGGRDFFFFLAVGESLGFRKKEGASKGKRQESNLEEDGLWKLSAAKRCLL